MAMPAQAQDSLDAGKVKAAIEKGVKWIKTRQKGDGSYDEGYLSQFPLGPTALATLTLIKAGYGRDVVAKKGLLHIRTKAPSKTYGTGLLLMALEARYAPSKAKLLKSGKGYSTMVRKRFKRAKPFDKRVLKGAADWLIKTRHKPLWGYPFGGGGMGGGNEWDHSNTQYALLGLGAAKRLGYRPPPRDLMEVLLQMLAGQEADGPKVESFFVPAADAPFAAIEKFAKDMAKARAKAARGSGDATVERIRGFYDSHEKRAMKARGWAYFPVGGPGKGPANGHPAAAGPQMYQPSPGMTAASLAIVVLLKGFLEKTKAYKKIGAKVDQAIRDGAGYLAHNWTLDDMGHPYYYLYGLERVGVLTGCKRFGEHDWYLLGGRKILAAQNADGSWGSASPVANGGLAQTPNALPQTCFSILFLAKATVPLIPDLPKRPETSAGGK